MTCTGEPTDRDRRDGEGWLAGCACVGLRVSPWVVVQQPSRTTATCAWKGIGPGDGTHVFYPASVPVSKIEQNLLQQRNLQANFLQTFIQTSNDITYTYRISSYNIYKDLCLNCIKSRKLHINRYHRFPFWGNMTNFNWDLTSVVKKVYKKVIYNILNLTCFTLVKYKIYTKIAITSSF